MSSISREYNVIVLTWIYLWNLFHHHQSSEPYLLLHLSVGLPLLICVENIHLLVRIQLGHLIEGLSYRHVRKRTCPRGVDVTFRQLSRGPWHDRGRHACSAAALKNINDIKMYTHQWYCTEMCVQLWLRLRLMASWFARTSLDQDPIKREPRRKSWTKEQRKETKKRKPTSCLFVEPFDELIQIAVRAIIFGACLKTEVFKLGRKGFKFVSRPFPWPQNIQNKQREKPKLIIVNKSQRIPSSKFNQSLLKCLRIQYFIKTLRIHRRRRKFINVRTCGVRVQYSKTPQNFKRQAHPSH